MSVLEVLRRNVHAPSSSLLVSSTSFFFMHKTGGASGWSIRYAVVPRVATCRCGCNMLHVQH